MYAVDCTRRTWYKNYPCIHRIPEERTRYTEVIMFVIRREPHNPILSPRREHPWEALSTYNPSVIREEKGWHMYYRALSNPAALVSPYAGQSTIGEAFSEDGLHFHSRR